MLVFNLTDRALDYRGIKLKANGGSYNYRDMTFVPDRDLALAESKVLSFGALPQWWIDARNQKHQEMVKAQEAATTKPKQPQPQMAQVAQELPTPAPTKDDGKEQKYEKRK